MPKIVALLIASAYIIYFIITPPLTIHDEHAHLKIIAGLAQGHYLLTDSDRSGDANKEIGVNEKLIDALRYVDIPDQIPTFNTVSKLKEEKNDYNAKDIYSHQAYSPPFYYLLGTLFYYISKVTPYILGQFYIMRLTSALFYFGTVFIAWRIVFLFVKNKKTASSILIFFSINPLVLKMGIGINPDIGVTFFSLCFLYYLLSYSSKVAETKNIVKISLISAIAAMTKISGIFTNAVFIFYILVFNKLRKKTIRTLLLFQGIFLAVTLPWFMFAFNRYGTFFPAPFKECPKIEYYPLTIKIFETFADFRFTLMQYSGFMGQGWPYPFKWFFASYVLLFTIFLIFGLVFVVRQKQRIHKTLIIYIVPLFLFLLTLSVQYRIKQIDCDIPGRYMMPAFLVLCLFVYWGIFAMTKNEQKAAKIMRGFAIFHFLFILFTVLIIRYYV